MASRASRSPPPWWAPGGTCAPCSAPTPSPPTGPKPAADDRPPLPHRQSTGAASTRSAPANHRARGASRRRGRAWSACRRERKSARTWGAPGIGSKPLPPEARNPPGSASRKPATPSAPPKQAGSRHQVDPYQQTHARPQVPTRPGTSSQAVYQPPGQKPKGWKEHQELHGKSLGSCAEVGKAWRRGRDSNP